MGQISHLWRFEFLVVLEYPYTNWVPRNLGVILIEIIFCNISRVSSNLTRCERYYLVISIPIFILIRIQTEQLLTLDTVVPHKCDNNIYFNGTWYNFHCIWMVEILYSNQNNPRTQLVNSGINIVKYSEFRIFRNFDFILLFFILLMTLRFNHNYKRYTVLKCL